MKIVYLCLEPLVPGSAADTHVNALAAGLRAEGVTVDIAGLAPDTRTRAGSVRRALIQLSLLRRVAAALHGATCLYVRAHPLAWPMVRLARRRGVPVVHEINGRITDIAVTHPSRRYLMPILRRLEQMQLRAAAGIVAVTPGLAAWAARTTGGGVPIATVPNGVDPQLFRPDLPRPEAAGAGPYVVFFGSFARWHGIGTIMAATALPQWPQAVRLLLVGPASQDGLGGGRGTRVEWLGMRARPELAAVVANALASLVVVEDEAGRAETGLAPLKLFESMAAGTAVVATRHPYQAELVLSADAGIIIDERDPAALAAAVARLAADPQHAARLGLNGRAAAVAHHSWTARARQTREFLLSLVDGVGSASADLVAPAKANRTAAAGR